MLGRPEATLSVGLGLVDGPEHGADERVNALGIEGGNRGQWSR